MKILFRKLVAYSPLAAIAALLFGCSESARSGYRIEDGEVVLYTGFPANRSVVKEANVATFKAINKVYSKDEKQVFYRGQPIAKADPATFEYLAGDYSKDRANGYFQEKRISTDGHHFDIVPNPAETSSNVTAEGIAYARDSRYVYRSTEIVKGADPATFKVVPMFNGNYLTHDRRYIYFHDRPIEGANGQSFRKIAELTFTDGRSVWGLELGKDTYWNRMTDVDITSLKSAGSYYALDKNHVYLGNDQLPDADPDTFEETGYLTGKDKNATYQSRNRSAN
ncbi:DKNYY domain-containing protein [Spirosoma sp. BT702]|uniref:DKNYY domain-containing protein n=1 Tax=Spirosoma profusum TaxID=2771354 RepID=A0A926Y0W1_9BACT|nr:DKNYY domain-containing protein [Spirosoma profusum]MBD2703846.1 DKNYY domain-containing protein [Spirosoma profusum]